MVVAPGLIVYERLLDAFCGKIDRGSATVGAGFRHVGHGKKFADLFIPEAHREAVFAFVRGNVCGKRDWPEGHGQRHDRHHQLAFAGRG
jgi:type III restriction enzyme